MAEYVDFAEKAARQMACEKRLTVNGALRYQTFVKRLAAMLTCDEPSNGAERYQNGSWLLERLDTDRYGEIFWWRLESDKPFFIANAMNGAYEPVDAEMLSMTVALMAASDLCGAYFEDGEKTCSIRHPVTAELLTQVNEAFHDIYHGLRDHFLDRLQADENRCGVLLRLID